MNRIFRRCVQGWLDKLAVGGRLFFHKVPVDDQAVGLFGKIKPVAEFNLGAGFAADENVDGRVIKTEDFVSTGHAAFPDEAFVCLEYGLRKLLEDVLDTVLEAALADEADGIGECVRCAAQQHSECASFRGTRRPTFHIAG
ncbi:MAG: hypothetical protein PWQ29_1310 [Verrucomicrobiota bacterium]|nr:hypothetical protein [Verrucomicrobiota bacterium]MDK2963916.1 hypothetical protein [Verrucomicrobiota bacterium]